MQTPVAPESASGALAPQPQLGFIERDQVSLEIQRVVRAHLRESQACWRSAYARRAPDAGTVAKIGVAFRVSGGSTHDVTSTGDPPGFSGLAACVTANVAHWRFPPALDFPLNVPFVFGGPSRSEKEIEEEQKNVVVPR